MRKHFVQNWVWLAAFSTTIGAQSPPAVSESQAAGRVERLHLPPLDRVLPSRADAIYQQLVVGVDPAVAMTPRA